MIFENTVWLYITPALLLITASMIALSLRKREHLLGKFAASRLLDQLTENASHTRTLIKSALILIGLAAIGIAIARPQYGVEWSQRKAKGLDIVFVLDSSKSMLATDIRPTRLDRAKLAVIDLVNKLESDRIGLVAFAGRAFLQTPPTLDYSAFHESLESIGPNTITSGGSDLGSAIKEAETAFPKDNNYKVIILLTDGEDLGGNSIKIAAEAAKNGIKVYAIGIGTPQGEYLRIKDETGKEDFIRDANGQPVRSQLDETTLQEITQLTGGSYSRLSAQSLNALYNSVISTLPRSEREAELQEKPIERFQWAIGLAMIALVVEMLIRRRSNTRIHASALAFILLLPALPQESIAQEDNLEIELPLPLDDPEDEEVLPAPPTDARKIYNDAYTALTSGDIETAQELYQNSIELTQDLKLQRNALYNLAHSNYQTGRQTYDTGDLETAIEQMKASEALFKSTLEIDPNDSEATEDLAKVEAVRKAIEAIKQKQEQQQEDQEQQDGDSEQEEQQEDGEYDQQEQQNENSEQQEQQDQEGQQQQSEQDSEDGQQSDSENQDGQESDQSQNENQQEQESDGEQNSTEETDQQGDDQQESTRNPVDDMEQENADDEAEQEATDKEEGNQPQPSESDQDGSEEGQTQSAANMQPIEGMSEEDAANLLETLRTSEKLLPFAEQGTPRKQGRIRDW